MKRSNHGSTNPTKRTKISDTEYLSVAPSLEGLQLVLYLHLTTVSKNLKPNTTDLDPTEEF
jgi:hypothetical protein